MYFLHALLLYNHDDGCLKLNKCAKTQGFVTGMSNGRFWHADCTSVSGARDTGDGNITSCSRFFGYRGEDGNRTKGDAVIPRCVAYFFAPAFCIWSYTRPLAVNLRSLVFNPTTDSLDTCLLHLYFRSFNYARQLQTRIR